VNRRRQGLQSTRCLSLSRADLENKLEVLSHRRQERREHAALPLEESEERILDQGACSLQRLEFDGQEVIVSGNSFLQLHQPGGLPFCSSSCSITSLNVILSCSLDELDIVDQLAGCFDSVQLLHIQR